MISPSQPRATQPRRWRSLALGASVTLAAASPALADLQRPAPISLAMPDARLWLAMPDASLWLAEGGEAGEAGALAAAGSAATYLAEIALVEGHMIAARDLYAKGQTGLAVDLSRHPEAEGMLTAVRTGLAAHEAADFSPAIATFTATMAKGAPLAEVEAALAAVSVGVAAAGAGEQAALRSRFDAAVLLLKAAAGEYSGSIAGGKVTDEMAYHEAHAFVALARRTMTELAAQPLTATAAPRALQAMQAADDAFGDMTKPELAARDPAILFGVAARVELIASSVR